MNAIARCHAASLEREPEPRVQDGSTKTSAYGFTRATATARRPRSASPTASPVSRSAAEVAARRPETPPSHEPAGDEHRAEREEARDRRERDDVRVGRQRQRCARREQADESAEPDECSSEEREAETRPVARARPEREEVAVVERGRGDRRDRARTARSPGRGGGERSSRLRPGRRRRCCRECDMRHPRWRRASRGGPRSLARAGRAVEHGLRDPGPRRTRPDRS